MFYILDATCNLKKTLRIINKTNKMNETKWKFKGQNMNLLNINTVDFPENKELLEIIDKLKRMN